MAQTLKRSCRTPRFVTSQRGSLCVVILRLLLSSGEGSISEMMKAAGRSSRLSLCPSLKPWDPGSGAECRVTGRKVHWAAPSGWLYLLAQLWKDVGVVV